MNSQFKFESRKLKPIEPIQSKYHFAFAFRSPLFSSWASSPWPLVSLWSLQHTPTVMPHTRTAATPQLSPATPTEPMATHTTLVSIHTPTLRTCSRSKRRQMDWLNQAPEPPQATPHSRNRKVLPGFLASESANPDHSLATEPLPSPQAQPTLNCIGTWLLTLHYVTLGSIKRWQNKFRLPFFSDLL